MDSVTVAADLLGSHESPANAEVEVLLEQRRSPGIIVVAPPMRILHMSQRAGEVLRDVAEIEHRSRAARATLATGLLPPAIRRICKRIFDLLRERPMAKDWECLESKLLIGGPQRPVLVRGLGVPSESGRAHSHVVVLLEEVSQRKEYFRKEMTQHFRFTEREQEVIQCLARGSTNKDIARDLRLALPTVKEHIRHIMDKVKANTRTGILAKVFRS